MQSGLVRVFFQPNSCNMASTLRATFARNAEDLSLLVDASSAAGVRGRHRRLVIGDRAAHGLPNAVPFF